MKLFVIFSLACSLVACGKGPKGTVCTFDQPHQLFVCVDKQGKDFDVNATNSILEDLKMVCLPNDYAKEYFKWCNRK